MRIAAFLLLLVSAAQRETSSAAVELWVIPPSELPGATF
jgi:hypothetical protein